MPERLPRSPVKFALVSHRLPPSSSGQAVVLHRMLREFGAEDYCLISNEEASPEAGGGGSTGNLPGRRHSLPPPPRLTRGHRSFLPLLREGANIPLAVIQHARRIAGIVRREGCGAVVACTGDVAHLPAGYLASRRAGALFYAYVLDHYSYREWRDPAAAFWARRFEPLVLKGAAAVIVPNEVLRDELRERHGVEAAVIHNSLDISPYEAGAPAPPGGGTRREHGGVNVVYTGDVYEAHYDAFRNLMAAFEALGRADLRLHIYSDRPPEILTEVGIRGAIVHHPHLDASEIPRVQMEADILFLPLAFASPYPDLVRTSATTKLGEYLAARRPLLVHAPSDSFVARYSREHGCGVVVGESSPAQLASAVERILGDAELRRRLSDSAWERARADFDIARARASFRNLLGYPADAGRPGRAAPRP